MTVVDYKIQMDPNIQAANTQLALSMLYRLLSEAWAYPGSELYESLKSGAFLNTINQSLNQIPHGELLTRAAQTLNEEFNRYLGSNRLIDMETDYVALFESNFEAPVIHLYQHLYVQQDRSQVDILKGLNQRYRRLGIALKQGEGVEQPDHLTVQLECMAYCYSRLAQSVEQNMASAANFYYEEIKDFKHELRWFEQFSKTLHRNSNHVFYLALAGFTHALLSTGQ